VNNDSEEVSARLLRLCLKATLPLRAAIIPGPQQKPRPHNHDHRVVATGTFKDSDAAFNVGLAMGALSTMNRPGVVIAMSGRVLPHDIVARDKMGRFVPIDTLGCIAGDDPGIIFPAAT